MRPGERLLVISSQPFVLREGVIFSIAELC